MKDLLRYERFVKIRKVCQGMKSLSMYVGKVCQGMKGLSRYEGFVKV